MASGERVNLRDEWYIIYNTHVNVLYCVEDPLDGTKHCNTMGSRGVAPVQREFNDSELRTAGRPSTRYDTAKLFTH